MDLIVLLLSESLMMSVVILFTVARCIVKSSALTCFSHTLPVPIVCKVSHRSISNFLINKPTSSMHIGFVVQVNVYIFDLKHPKQKALV